MKKFSTLLNKIDDLNVSLAAILLYSLCFLCFAGVIMRYVVQKPLAWADEMDRYLFVWFSYIGSAIAAKKGGHVAVDNFVNMFPPKTKKLLNIISKGISLVIVSIILRYSITGSLPLVNQLSAGMQVPMIIPYSAIAISFLYYALLLIYELITEVNRHVTKEVIK